MVLSIKRDKIVNSPVGNHLNPNFQNKNNMISFQNRETFTHYFTRIEVKSGNPCNLTVITSD